MQILKFTSIISWLIAVGLIIVSAPHYSLVPDVVIANIAFVVVPVCLVSSVLWFLFAIYRKGMSTARDNREP
jgi:hypothetical protein